MQSPKLQEDKTKKKNKKETQLVVVCDSNSIAARAKMNAISNSNAPSWIEKRESGHQGSIKTRARNYIKHHCNAGRTNAVVEK
jgi:hypothetical protein